MGLFGQKNKFFGKKQKEAQNTGKPKLEYIQPTWTDEAVPHSPLDFHRAHLEMPALRYHMVLPPVECLNQWTGKIEFISLRDPDCELAKKYTEVYFHNALPIKGAEDLFYPFSDETIQLVENIIKKLEEINNIEKIRNYMAEHMDDEVIVATGEWFLGDYMNYETGNNYPNDTIYWKKMKEREIKLYGQQQVP